MRVVFSCALLITLIATSVDAADPFSLTASGGGNSVTATGSNLVDLAGNLIDAKDQFQSLNNQNVSGSLRYGGLNNAVLFSRNAAGTSATLTIPSTGFSRTFTAATQSQLEDQVVDFFKTEGASAYAKFLGAINENTSLGVNDGNQQATTAMIADLGFYRFGFITRRPGDESIPLPGGVDFKISGGVVSADAGTDSNDDLNGWYGEADLGLSLRFGDRVALTWANGFRYRDVEGAAIYNYGTTIGLPIAIIPGKEAGFSWRITPAFVGGFGGSWDLAAGGILVGGQLTNSMSIHAGGWTVTMGNQIGFYNGVPVSFSDFDFETDVDQTILKNGVQVARDLGDSAFIDAGVAYTNFLENAFVDNYISPDVGIGCRLGSGVVRVGYHGDIASDFQSHGANLSLVFTY